MSLEPDVMREYPGDGVIVEWHASRCIHSGNCARGLPLVFDPKRRPWIDPSSATADQIVEVVMRCPSGALQFRRTDGPDVP